jgi:hypothetical protein
VLDYLDHNCEACAVNQDFHEEFHKQFPGFKRKETLWGAQPVARAMAALTKLHMERKISRVRIGLRNWQPGFPKWVWSYSIGSGQITTKQSPSRSE